MKTVPVFIKVTVVISENVLLPWIPFVGDLCWNPWNINEKNITETLLVVTWTCLLLTHLQKTQNVSVSLSNNVHTKAVHLHTLLAVWVRSYAVVASMLRCRAGAGSGSGLCPSSTSHRAGGPGTPATPTSMNLTETEVLPNHWRKKTCLGCSLLHFREKMKQYSGFRNVIHFAGAKGHLHM